MRWRNCPHAPHPESQTLVPFLVRFREWEPPWTAAVEETEPRRSGGCTLQTSCWARGTCTGRAPSRSARASPTRLTRLPSTSWRWSTRSWQESRESTTTTATGTGSSKSSATPPTWTTSPPSTAASPICSIPAATSSPSPATPCPSSTTPGPYSPILPRKPCTTAISGCSPLRRRRPRRVLFLLHNPNPRPGETLDRGMIRPRRLGRTPIVPSPLSRLGRLEPSKPTVERVSGPRALTVTFCMNTRRDTRSVPWGARVAGGGFMQWWYGRHRRWLGMTVPIVVGVFSRWGFLGIRKTWTGYPPIGTRFPLCFLALWRGRPIVSLRGAGLTMMKKLPPRLSSYPTPVTRIPVMETGG